MLLTPTEMERLTVFTAAELARKHRAKGVEAQPGDVLPGVADLMPMIQVEGTFPDGTKLVTVHDPLEGQNPTSPEPYALRSVVQLSRREFEHALNQSAQAITLGPNHSFVHAIAALVSLLGDKPQRAVELTRMATRLCPIYPAWYLSVLGRANWFSGQKDEAITNSQAAARLNPDLIFPHLLLAIAYIDQDRTKEAGAEVDEVLRIDPGYTTTVFSATQPIRNTDVLAQHVGALRKAGLPE